MVQLHKVLGRRWLRRWLAVAATAGLAGSGLAVGAPSASAAPLPAAYSATATGDVLTAASSIVGANLLATDLVHSTSAVDSTDATAPSTATSANLGLRLGPVGVRAANTEAAPPDSADSGGLASVTLPGVLSTGVLTYTDEATWAGANACVPAGQPISRALTTTTGASVGALGVNVLQTGVSSVTTTTSLTAQSPTHDTRGVTSTAQGNVAGLALLGGAVRVSALQPELSTTATSGAAGSASITGSSVQVTGPGIGTVTLVAGADLTVSVPLVGSVTLHLASNADIVAAGGTFSTTYLTARVSLLAGTGTVTLGILPLTVAATAPAGGVECDTTAPAINIVAPADGSTVPDATPTFSGTSGVLSGSVTLAIDGGSPITVPTAADGSWSYTPTTPLSETTHTAVATATDTAGNSATDSTSFTVDVPPAVAITEPADGSATNDATPAITGTSNVLSGSIRLAIDGGAPATVPTAADGSWSYTPATALGEGPHEAVATATDPQGNTATDSSTFTVDTTAPAVAITAPADGSVTNDPTPAITGTSDVLNGSISLTIDAGTPVSVTTGADGSWTYTPTTDLADGSHTAVARATDAAGNTASDSSTFTIDTTAPAVAITAPADGSSTNDATPTITGTSDVLNGSISLTIDAGTPVSVTTGADGSWTYTPTTDLADGSHTAVARATDAAGNTASDSSTFTIDTTAPAIAITAPADGSSTNDATPPITGTSDVLNGSISLTIDGGAPVTVDTGADGSWTYTPATALGEGSHTAVARATDAAGNTASDSSTFTVDTTAPAVAITAPADGSVTNDATPVITGTSDVLNGSISLAFDGGTPVSVSTGADGSWTYTPTTDFADGSHTAVARATDAAGNTASDSSTFTIDTTAPAVAITAPADGSTTNDSTPPMTGTSDVISGTVLLSIDGTTPVSVDTGADGSWAYTPPAALTEGGHTLTATASDEAGNTATDSSTFTVDTIAPAVAITAPADGSSTNDATPPITGTSDIVNGTISLVIDGGDPVTVNTGADGSWSYTPTTALGDGSHTAEATAKDDAGNTSSDSSTFTVDTTAPAIAITSPADGSTTNDATPPITGTSDIVNGTISLVIDGGDPVTVNTGADGSWTYTPTTALSDRSHTAEATATDGAGNTASDSSTFTVDTTAPAIAITSPADGSTTNDQTPAITGTSDIVNGTISLVIDGGDPVTVNTGANGSWSYTPTTALGDGSHTAEATATDGAGNTATASSTFTVDTSAPAIAITAPADGSTTNDATPTISGSSDILNGTIMLKLDDASPMRVATGADGSWASTPTEALSDGEHAALASATDEANNTATDQISFTVDTSTAPPGQEPTVDITSPADGSTLGSAPPAVTGTSNAPGHQVSVTLDGEPLGTDTVDTDGTWSVPVTRSIACGHHVITATVGDFSAPVLLNDVVVLADAADPSSDTVGFTLTCPAGNGPNHPGEGGPAAGPRPGGLAFTGLDPAMPVGLGMLLIAVGAAAYVTRRTTTR